MANHGQIDETEILAGANREIAAMEDQGPINVQLPISDFVLLYSQVQLALRHPANVGLSAQRARVLLDTWRAQIAVPGGSLDTLLRLGDDPQYDYEPARTRTP